MNNVKAIQNANEEELRLGIAGGSGSWHARYTHSPVIYIGGIPKNLNEDDILTIFEQMGTIVHVNLVRDEETGRPRGFAFIAYEDIRSTVIAVDNFNGTDLSGSTLCVDHVDNYKPPAPEKAEALTSLDLRRNESSDLDIGKGLEYGCAEITGDSAPKSPENLDPRKSAKHDDAENVRLQQMMHRLAAMRQKRDALEKHDQPAASVLSDPSRMAVSGHVSHERPRAEAPLQESSVDNQGGISRHHGTPSERLRRKEERRRIREQRAERRSKRDVQKF